MFILNLTHTTLRFLISMLMLPLMWDRFLFEKKNKMPLHRSFKDEKITADLFFEVSSEGELEQSRPIIVAALMAGKYVELCYCSESVENKVLQLSKEHPKNLRSLRLPLLTLSFWGFPSLYSWATAPKVILCRYDFFPELFLLPSREFYLVSATLKNKEGALSHPFKRWLLVKVYSRFKKIFAATPLDLASFQDLLGRKEKIFSYDFRHVQILNRLAGAGELFKTKAITTFIQLIEEYPRHLRLVHGSAWAIEMPLYASAEFQKKIRQRELLVVLAPHQLGGHHYDELLENLKHQVAIPIYEIDKLPTALHLEMMTAEFRKNPGIIISRVPGILCEFYSLFGHAYVGGGHGRSIHSLLEPYWAGCKTYCGPKTHRSTEFDYFMHHAPRELKVITLMSDFYSFMMEDIALLPDLDKRGRVAASERERLQPMLGELL